ncbi:MAG TPA: tetratricopeptide repeat protein, partial [Nannocystis exedens]|nr:tetratricopeptide repeat protein [Nannocystis exedens]
RSDQFSYCVTLYEALYGEHPFAGETLHGLKQSVEEGTILNQPSSVRVPAWLRSALLRGLAPRPEDRWPSMQALLEALSHDPARRRRRWLQAAGIVALLGIGGAAALTINPTRAPTCEDMERHLVGVWDHDRRSDVENAIVSTGLAYAPDTWERVQSQLDSYTAAWVVAREDACVSTRQGEQSAHLLDLRIACLDQQLLHVEAVVEELARTDKSSVQLAVKMAAQLPTLERCARTDLLTAKQPPPEDPEVAARVAALDNELVRARAKGHAGHFDEGLALTEAVLADGVPLDYEPLLARAWLTRGDLRGLRGDFTLAQADLERALEAALALDMKEVSAQAATNLMFYVGYKQARLEEGTRWSALARALTRASRDNTRQIQYLTAAGDLTYSNGKFDEARDLWTEALKLFDRTELPGTTKALNRSKILSNLGIVARKLGHNAEAREYHTQALAIAERLLGPAHPDVADILEDMGNLAKTEGNFAAAKEYWERALTLAERSLGPEHPRLAATLANLGSLATKEGEYAKAHTYLERALAIDQKALGPDHPEVAGDLTSLGRLALSEGEYAKAKTLYLQALTIREQELGPDNPGVIYPLANLGVLMGLMDDDESALLHFRRASAIAEETLGADHALVAKLLTSIGTSLVSVGDPTAAVDNLERALQIRVSLNENNRGAELDLALTRSELARALWLAKKPDRARARSLAELALSAYTAQGRSKSTESKRVQVWLEEHTP